MFLTCVYAQMFHEALIPIDGFFQTIALRSHQQDGFFDRIRQIRAVLSAVLPFGRGLPFKLIICLLIN